ncbi:olfactory receptor 10T2-like [Physeter macrocephalus]|uniref:Olfactory receptor 10T2-like n=1 Tax=Physeter macrocephalus TaxID=9755 RepID=A0A2Y9TL26_PHYMC|nr:olfactory receptor 10T2-like [Physeter catodon]|eukprot:XP_023990104.1 olfactory receptor 10T2-like [Physeter catodon]
MAHKSGLTSSPPPPILVSESVPEKQWENATWLVTEFMVVGFSTFPGLRITLFALFFLTYLVTLSGNVTIITITHADRTLHTPMYRFLAALSLSETCYTLVTIPNMLAHLLMKSGAISIPGYWAQMFFFLGLGCSCCFLRTLMGYYRYVAICHPLRYWVIMRPTVCLYLGALVFCFGSSVALIEASLIFSSPFCHSDSVEHFFCDITPVLKLSCAGSASKALAIFFLSIFVVLVSFLLILLSYTFTVAALLRIPSAAGRPKAFSTCVAHLIVHFVPHWASIIDLRPESRGNPDQDRLVAVLYTVVTPLLTPVVYTAQQRCEGGIEEDPGAKPRSFKNKHSS